MVIFPKGSKMLRNGEIDMGLDALLSQEKKHQRENQNSQQSKTKIGQEQLLLEMHAFNKKENDSHYVIRFKLNFLTMRQKYRQIDHRAKNGKETSRARYH